LNTHLTESLEESSMVTRMRALYVISSMNVSGASAPLLDTVADWRYSSEPPARTSDLMELTV
jgi:hypothetical protein